MSEEHATDTDADPLFTVSEVEQFTDDDTVAGRAIGKMLSALFLYTVFGMTLVTWWTVSSIAADRGADSQEQAAVEDHAGGH